MRVFPLTEDPSRFSGLTACLLVSPDEKTRRPVKILSIRTQGNHFLLSVDGTATKEAAQSLNGFFLSVPREEAIPLPAGRHFIFDLVGCEVFEAGCNLGRLRDVLQTGANDVYVVTRPGKKDLLIPVTREIIRSIDIASRRIDVMLPEGLLEIYE